MSENLGRFTWYELMTTDPAAGIDFYSRLMGWGSMPLPGAMHYDLFTQGGAPIAGVRELPEQARDAGAPTHWVGYVHTPDVDATAAQAQELGGTVLAHVDIADVGRVAVLLDPQGAAIAAFQPENTPRPDREPQLGEVCWHELSTTDYVAGFDFYQALFGWEIIEDMDMGAYGMYRLFGRNGKPFGGMHNKAPDAPGWGWLYYTLVADCQDAADRLQALGGTVLAGPMEVPGDNIVVQATDPQGGRFALSHIVDTAAKA